MTRPINRENPSNLSSSETIFDTLGSRLPSSACISEKQRAGDRLNDLRLVYSAAAGTSAKKEAINSLGDKVGPEAEVRCR